MRTMLRRARYRAVFLLVFAVFLLGAVEVRLFVLQVLRARPLERSPMYRIEDHVERGQRGDIVDRRGGLLASSRRTWEVWGYTSELLRKRTTDEDPARVVALELARITGVEPGGIEKTLNGGKKWVRLVEGIRNPAVVAELRELTLLPRFRPLTIEERFERVYPRDAFLAPLVGWVGWQPSAYPEDDERYDADGEFRGIFGIELACERALAPADGRRPVRRDGRRRDMVDPALEETAARAGRAVELTVEPLAQDIVEEALDAALAEFRPLWAQAIVIDPRDGEVKALAQRPTPGSPRPRDAEDARNHKLYATQVLYPPGSSFKPFMLGLVLERGAATPETTVDCDNGSYPICKGRVIHDVHPKGVLSATDVLVHSSNIGMTKLVRSLFVPGTKKGDPAFQPILDHIKSLGFKRRISSLPYEEDGLLPRLRDMDLNWSLASLSYGQEIGTTALQVATAAAAIANGGTWRPPRFVHAIEGDDGEMVEVASDPAREHRVFTPATNATLKTMLAKVVEEGGTGKWRPRGWSMGGKTGTAQNELHHEISISSYWCFAPVADPRYLVLVVLYDPKQGRFAADNAAKVAGGIMGSLLRRFEVPADRPEELVAELAREAALARGARPLPPARPRLRASSALISDPAAGEGR
jgi:cell division protein FtsI/penicillin-binding protein 2